MSGAAFGAFLEDVFEVFEAGLGPGGGVVEDFAIGGFYHDARNG